VQAPVQAPAPAAAPQTADLQTMLSAAGLTLANTDPAKLRAAQEAAAQIHVTPHVPRERKPQPASSSEPLVQVETRH